MRPSVNGQQATVNGQRICQPPTANRQLRTANPHKNLYHQFMLISVVVGVTALVLGGVIGWLTANRRALVAEARLAAMDQDKFLALAQRAFAQVGETLVRTNKAQVDGSLETKRAEIDGMLAPVRQMLDQYRGEVQKSEKARVEAYGGLQEQIRSLLTTTESAQREASRLANALQSPTVRGSWGESSLRRCVELAGMSEFCDFDTQPTFATDEGRRVRPDLVVRLPNNRVIAVDAKVPLSDYTVAANETDDKRRAEEKRGDGGDHRYQHELMIQIFVGVGGWQFAVGSRVGSSRRPVGRWPLAVGRWSITERRISRRALCQLPTANGQLTAAAR